MKKKLLFLTARLPYPGISGRKNVMYHYCKYLHEVCNFEIINVSFLEDGDDTGIKPDFIGKTYTLANPGFGSKVYNLLIETLLTHRKPLQVSLYYDRRAGMRIDEIIKRERPDVLMCDMIRTSEYLKGYDIPKILDMDDLLSVRYERQLKSDMDGINHFGAYLYKLPAFLQRKLTNRNIGKFLLNTEVRLLKEYEKKICGYYDAVILVSQGEADKLNGIIAGRKAFSIPVGVNVDYFKNAINNAVKIKNSISFLGALNVAHNEAAVIYFCSSILPRVRSKIPNARFFVVGSGTSEKIKDLESDSVIVVGKVDDIREYIAATEVFVCPLLFGSGIKTKNLEAMAMKIPVVTTGVGAESINASDNRHWLVRDGEREFADAVIEILKDHGLRERLQYNGYDYVSRNFSWDIVLAKWDGVLNYIFQHTGVCQKGNKEMEPLLQ